MARHAGRQGPWPRTDVTGSGRNTPTGRFLSPDGVFASNRELVGPLRTGTAPGCGPRGRAVEAADSVETDMGLDRVTPRGRDPMGWPVKDPQPASGLVATQVRRPAGRAESMTEAGARSGRMRF